MRRRTVGTGAAALLATTSICHAGDDPVLVFLDMDGATPGIQSTVTVTSCADLVLDVAVYVVDPLGKRTMWSIGYFGGINRGIALGHVPDQQNTGVVTGIEAAPDTPVNPANFGEIIPDVWVDPAFEGIEVQYVECCGQTPATISADPTGPIFTASVALADTQPGDEFSFYVADFVSIWRASWPPDLQGGAFSTQGPSATLDTGGDSVPDGTPTVLGPDGDEPVPVPPASFFVDYVDGPGRIVVGAAPGDVDGDGIVDVHDLIEVILQWGPCTECEADLNGDGVVDVTDLTEVLLGWGDC